MHSPTIAVRIPGGIAHFARQERVRYRGRWVTFERDRFGCPYLTRRDGSLRKNQPIDDERHWFWAAFKHWTRKHR